MITKLSTFRAQQADRDAITDCLHLYTRGIDRCDGELLRCAFWDDAHIRGDLFEGDRAGFIQYSTVDGKGFFAQMMHMVGNIIIRIDGAQAALEACFYGYHAAPAEADYGDLVIGGRYLDRFELRYDEWRILEKTIMFDWHRQYPDAAGTGNGPMGSTVKLRGERGPGDLSYALFEAFGA